ncbi:unnamed protein product [Orchesella dallaii]|uniref:Chitin-binding type-2 domain-containing protein n=1 Tax=Orchesella dallaii TaxID=48710 RepID=A0ABP1RLX3_9HEXA
MKYILIFVFCLALVFGLSVGQDEQCPSEGIAYIPLQDCSRYLICIHGRGQEQECHRPLYFSPELRSCDFPENVPECLRGTRPPVTTTPMPPTTPPAPPGALTQCGETIEANSGIIQYKLGQNYEAGELCTFIIRTPQTITTHFNLEEHGISESDPEAIKMSTYGPGGIIFVASMGPPKPAILNIFGSGAIITFRTKTNLGTGFRLSFDTVPFTQVELPGKNVVYTNETSASVSLPFPSGYVNELHYNYLVISPGSRYISEPGSNLQLSITPLEGFTTANCSNYLTIHVLELTGSSQWRGNFCNADTSPRVYQTPGIFIVLFHQGGSTPAQVRLNWEVVRSAKALEAV